MRDPKLLEDDECLLPHAVGLGLNVAFLAAAARLNVGLGEPAHVRNPYFRDAGRRAAGLEVAITDLDYLDTEF